MGLRILSREETLTMLGLAGEVHGGTRELPTEIREQRRKIADAIRNGELWMIRLRIALPQTMVDDIVRMKFQLDALYGAWTTSETPTIH